MKYYTFHRESNNFIDILTDNNIKQNVCLKITFRNRLIIGFKNKVEDSILGYIVLKYGDDIVNLTDKDYTPKPDIDYTPKRN